MHSFAIERPRDLAAALAFRSQAGRKDAPVEYIAGGTDMVQLLQEYVRRPERLVSTTASQAAMEDGSAVIALICACAARASMQAPDQRHGEPSSHGGDRVRHVSFGPDRERRGVGNLREGEALRSSRRHPGLRGKLSPARRSGSHKPRCTVWRGGGSRASRGPRSARARLPA